MSKASVWAALVSVASYGFAVTRAGGCGITAPPEAADLTATDAIALRDWLTTTFGLL